MNNPTPQTQQIVCLLQEIESGNKASLEKLYHITYQDLKSMAHGIKIRFHGQHTLNTTALVHEAYLKINKAHQLTFNNKAHYLGTLGKVIRHVLINYIEQKKSQKRGALQKAYSLDDWHERISVPEVLCEQIMQLHEALQLLAQEHEMMASALGLK
jgi:RNA polymerase sigma factor (TIGR02999 family)